MLYLINAQHTDLFSNRVKTSARLASQKAGSIAISLVSASRAELRRWACDPRSALQQDIGLLPQLIPTHTQSETDRQTFDANCEPSTRLCDKGCWAKQACRAKLWGPCRQTHSEAIATRAACVSSAAVKLQLSTLLIRSDYLGTGFFPTLLAILPVKVWACVGNIKHLMWRRSASEIAQQPNVSCPQVRLMWVRASTCHGKGGARFVTVRASTCYGRGGRARAHSGLAGCACLQSPPRLPLSGHPAPHPPPVNPPPAEPQCLLLLCCHPLHCLRVVGFFKINSPSCMDKLS